MDAACSRASNMRAFLASRDVFAMPGAMSWESGIGLQAEPSPRLPCPRANPTFPAGLGVLPQSDGGNTATSDGQRIPKIGLFDAYAWRRASARTSAPIVPREEKPRTRKKRSLAGIREEHRPRRGDFLSARTRRLPARRLHLESSAQITHAYTAFRPQHHAGIQQLRFYLQAIMLRIAMA